MTAVPLNAPLNNNFSQINFSTGVTGVSLHNKDMKTPIQEYLNRLMFLSKIRKKNKLLLQKRKTRALGFKNKIRFQKTKLLQKNKNLKTAAKRKQLFFALKPARIAYTKKVFLSDVKSNINFFNSVEGVYSSY